MKRYGFNFQWLFVYRGEAPQPVDLAALDFLAEEEFDFVRIPTDYNFWTRDFDYFHPDETVFEQLDACLAACRQRGIHMSLNLHRAPGYCINRNEQERDNLWTDTIAQDAFVFLWETFARRYRHVPPDALSFDLLNEPPGIGQYGMTRQNHATIMRRTAAAIRRITPDRPIVIDGLGGGNLAMPELANLGAIHSGRGYQPMAVSHYQATWWDGYHGLPQPAYPGTEWAGTIWNRDALVDNYRPWRQVEAMGVDVHIGEFGCYNQTPNDVALRWLADLLSVCRENALGYAMWNFKGSFGIVQHGRPGARYELLHGFQVDRDLLELLKANR